MLTGEAVSRVLLFQSFRHQDKLLLEIAPTKTFCQVRSLDFY